MGPGQAGGAHFSVLCYSPLPIFRGGYWLPIDIKLVEFLSYVKISLEVTDCRLYVLFAADKVGAFIV